MENQGNNTGLTNKIFLYIGGVFLTGMILLTCANILLRFVWFPIRGTFELMGFFGAVVVSFSLAYTQIKRGHIAVDILTGAYSPKLKRITDIINNFVCLLFFSAAAWQLAEKATVLLKTGEVTETLGIVYYPFTYGVAAGCAILCLVFVSDLIKIISRR